MKTSREQFEFEMSKFGDCVDMRRAKNGDQEYMAWDVGLAWRMWQASRQCIEVGLDDRVKIKLHNGGEAIIREVAKIEIVEYKGA